MLELDARLTSFGVILQSVSTIRGLCCIIYMILKDYTLCVLENEAITTVSAKTSSRHLAFRPKTHRAHSTMFRTFIENADTKLVLSFLECFVSNACSPCMIANYVSAIRGHFCPI